MQKHRSQASSAEQQQCIKALLLPFRVFSGAHYSLGCKRRGRSDACMLICHELGSCHVGMYIFASLQLERAAVFAALEM